MTVFQVSGLRAALLTAIGVLSLALAAAVVTRATGAAPPAATTADDG